MTREDTQKLLLAIEAAYPNFKPENASLTVDTWHWALEEYPAEAVKAGLQIYIKTNNTGFAPSVAQIIGCIHAPKHNDQPTEGEAWYLVREAIRDSNYNSEERFAKLPPLIQRAVGGASMLRQWAMMDSDEVNSVISSNFQRTYKAVLAQQEFADKVPQQLADVVRLVSDKVSSDRLLESSERGENSEHI